MIKVDALQTKEIAVELTDHTVRNIILSKTYEILDLPMGAYLEDGLIKIDIEGYYLEDYETEVIRKATDDDIAGLLIINRMKQKL